MDPAIKNLITSNLRRIYQASIEASTSVGEVARKSALPLFGAAALSPVIGYQLDKAREKNQPPPPPQDQEITEQRVEPPDISPKMSMDLTPPEELVMHKASFAVRLALAPVPSLLKKEAALETLKMELDGAKKRAKRRSGFVQGEQRDLESGDQIQPVSDKPMYR